MSFDDVFNDIHVASLLPPLIRTANVSGTPIDLTKYNGNAVALLHVENPTGAEASSTFSVAIWKSALVDKAGAVLVGTFTTVAVGVTAAADFVEKLAVKLDPAQPWVYAIATTSGQSLSPGYSFSVSIAAGGSRQRPIS